MWTRNRRRLRRLSNDLQTMTITVRENLNDDVIMGPISLDDLRLMIKYGGAWVPGGMTILDIGHARIIAEHR